MTDERKTAPGVTSTGDGRERDTLQCVTFSIQNYTIAPGSVASVLLPGKESALPGREIKRILGWRDSREVTAQVEAERHAGVPICASCDGSRPGYYLAASAGELAGYTASLRRRIKAVSVTLEAMETVLEKWRRGHE